MGCHEPNCNNRRYDHWRKYGYLVSKHATQFRQKGKPVDVHDPFGLGGKYYYPFESKEPTPLGENEK